MWAYIQAASQRLGPVADAYLKWAEWVQETGGDDPEKAADLVAELMSDAAAAVNAVSSGSRMACRPPIPSWSTSGDVQPWRK